MTVVTHQGPGSRETAPRFRKPHTQRTQGLAGWRVHGRVTDPNFETRLPLPRLVVVTPWSSLGYSLQLSLLPWHPKLRTHVTARPRLWAPLHLASLDKVSRSSHDPGSSSIRPPPRSSDWS